tara:strand:+ start:483 stop:1277 length:795 start_codon:yes stop_codon:yes gene_type:complete
VNKVKIVSGWSNRGGSTTAFINLTNALNKSNIDCTFYGPHTWHLEKCKSGLLKNCAVSSCDNLIVHFLSPPRRPAASRVILACHEKNVFEVSKIKPFWDEVVFLNKKQQQYHSKYTGKYTIIPNLAEELKANPKPNDNIAGIIGSIDENKQTHVSIERAIKDNSSKVYLFGTINDPSYYNNYVKPLLSDKVIHYGYLENKQQMYDMIDKVYLSSLSECASLVIDECKTTNTGFCGNSAVENDSETLTNDIILERWKKILNYNCQ